MPVSETMMFKIVASALAIATATAELAADSPAGASLISKARRVEGNNGNEQDFSWLTRYSIKFNSCHTIHSYGGGGENNGNGDGDGNNSRVGVQHLVKFGMCPSSGGCKSCSNGGEYIAELRDFVESYVEAKEEMQENNCKAVEENCNCNYYYGDDYACMAQCYATAGLDYCAEDENENEFDVAEYMECREAEFGNYYNSYYIGPVCANGGKSINLAVFTDSSCTTYAPSGTYERYNYYSTLPYSKKSMVDSGCISCLQDDGNDDNYNKYYNKYYNAEASEMCQAVYEQSAKCETNLKSMAVAYRDTSSCDYIKNIMPALENVYNHKGGRIDTPYTVFFVMTTIAASAAAYYFHTKVERANVALSSQGGNQYQLD